MKMSRRRRARCRRALLSMLNASPLFGAVRADKESRARSAGRQLRPVDRWLWVLSASQPWASLAAVRRRCRCAGKQGICCFRRDADGAAARHETRLLPVDSEHNSVFQLLDGRDGDTPSKMSSRLPAGRS